MKSLQEFILLCDQKREKNSSFSVKEEFNALKMSEQSSILKSINKTKSDIYKFDSLPEEIQILINKNYEPGRRVEFKKTLYDNLPADKKISVLEEMMEIRDRGPFPETKEEPFVLEISSPQYKMMQDLKDLLEGASELDSSSNEVKGFSGQFHYPKEGESITFIDAYEGKSITIKNIDGVDYIDGHAITIEQEDSYAKISYTLPSIRNKFLNELERAYYERSADEGLITINQMINRGMIRKVAEAMDANSIYDPTSVAKLCSVFEDQSSFLHLSAKKMTTQQLRGFIENIPMDLRKPYLELTNIDGREVIDLVANEPDKLALIRQTVIEREQGEELRLDDDNQSVHGASIHKTADQSLVKLAKNSLGLECTTDNDGATIHLDHDKAKDFVEQKLAKLQERLKLMLNYTELELFNYIEPSLDERQKSLDIDNLEIKEILGFRRFQIEKATSLMDDVILNGHTGNQGKYHVDVNTVNNSNGLSVKEMIALCYNAIEQTDKLIVGNKLDADGKPVPKKYSELTSVQERDDFLKTTEFKFIDGLYGIRRGYNIDHGEDKPEAYKYTINADYNVCPGGTINRLPQSLSSLHEDIEVIIANPTLLKLRILNDAPRIINTIIANTSEEQRPLLAFQLNEWKGFNKMPGALRNKVHELLKEEFKQEGNEVIVEYAKFFTMDAIIRHTGEGLMQYPYPKNKITEVQLTSNISLDPADRKYINSLPKYTKNNEANHQLTIDNLLQKDPTFMIALLDQYHSIENNYVLRDGQLTPILTDWLTNHGEKLLDKPDTTLIAFQKAPDDFKILFNKTPQLMITLLSGFSTHQRVSKDALSPLMKDWLEGNGRTLLDQKMPLNAALSIVPGAFKDFFSSLSDEEFQKCIRPIINVAENGQGNVEVLKAIPEDKFMYFKSNLDYVLYIFSTNSNIEGVKALLDIGVDPDAQVQFSNQTTPEPTALYKAVCNENNEIVKMLLDAGADINLARYNEQTALDVVKRKAKTALDMVKRKANTKIVEMLEEYSRNPVDYLLESHQNNPVGFIKAIGKVKSRGYDFEQHQSPDRFWDLDSEKVTKFLNKEIADGKTTNFRKIIKSGNKNNLELALLFGPDITVGDVELIQKFYPDIKLNGQKFPAAAMKEGRRLVNMGLKAGSVTTTSSAVGVGVKSDTLLKK